MTRLTYGAALIYPGLPVVDGWTMPLTHRCYRCGWETKLPTRPGMVAPHCPDCHGEGVEHSMRLFVPPPVWFVLSLN